MHPLPTLLLALDLHMHTPNELFFLLPLFPQYLARLTLGQGSS